MCHLIFVCKYRKPLLRILGDTLKTIISNIAKKINIEILEMEVDNDHLHLLIQYNPNKYILDIVRNLKQISTYQIWKRHVFRSSGYFACSIGQG